MSDSSESEEKARPPREVQLYSAYLAVYINYRSEAHADWPPTYSGDDLEHMAVVAMALQDAKAYTAPRTWKDLSAEVRGLLDKLPGVAV